MLKIIDVDWLHDHVLELTFNDGFHGKADLSDYFQKPPFDQISDFICFALTAEGALRWDDAELSATTLRAITQGELQPISNVVNVEEMEAVLKQAAWESMQEDRPDILQAALRAYVEQLGHKRVTERAGIKSRTSAYRSLDSKTKPNFGTLVKLGHAVIELAQENNATQLQATINPTSPLLPPPTR
ncbi:DUF2442 domain-containing protein [Celerinatantimonas sp. YJH-8]|uniref:type II toxin-antitoxin system antitoxin DhiA n=1 Tax=Celerinatantimonas sp. YJH-8 TaxID=3228714 RepID=UPI0038CBF148